MNPKRHIVLNRIQTKTKKKLANCLFVGVILGFLWGCGQNGPLYLPDQPPPITVPADRDCIPE